MTADPENRVGCTVSIRRFSAAGKQERKEWTERMTNFLIRKFIPDWENGKAPAVRAKYAVLAGILGILCNLLLFAVKFVIGHLTGSIAVTSDAFNNLSDLGSSAVSVISARLAAQRPDNEHPYGHGRVEYVAALGLSSVIMMVGIGLLRSSFGKLLHPSPAQVQPVLLAILALSVGVKLWMWYYNRTMGKMTDSAVLAAAASDSASDAAATGAVILSSVLGTLLPPTFPVSIDGVMGLTVSLLILRTGVGIAKKTVDRLLGSAPDPALTETVEAVIRSGNGIVGVHDLMIHDYGPGRIFASAHAEVPDTADINRAHALIDGLERKILAETGVACVLHMDPVSVGNARVDALRETVTAILDQAEPKYSLHDFRVSEGENRIRLIFDLVVPMSEPPEVTAAHLEAIRAALSETNPQYTAVIRVDYGIERSEKKNDKE